MSLPSLTLARTIGPIVREIERSGGSVARVFRVAGLPRRMTEAPDALMLLRDQFRLLDCAVREIDDPALPARLSSSTGSDQLGALSARFATVRRMDAAVGLVDTQIAGLLQTATRLPLQSRDGQAAWIYDVGDPAQDRGRRLNELLALGYMLDLLRAFAGRGWTPRRATVAGSFADRAGVEAVLQCPVEPGSRTAIEFDARWLEAENTLAVPAGDDDVSGRLPPEQDLIGWVRHVAALELLERRPRLLDVARRLGCSSRTLQRRLEGAGTRYAAVLDSLLQARALALLAERRLPVTGIAYELGYADAAHFTRAFRAWTGQAPSAWRRNRV